MFDIQKNTRLENNFNMKVDNLLLKRRSIREYNRNKMEFENLYEILKVAFNTPVVGNVTDYEVLIISDVKKKREISHICEDQIWMQTAPYYIIVLSNPEHLKDLYPKYYKKYATLNSGAFIQSIISTASLYDYSTCWVGAYDEEKLGSYISVDSSKICGVITIGKSDNVILTPIKPEIKNKLSFEKLGTRERKRIDFF